MTNIIGKTEAEAEQILTQEGKKMRVANRDGQYYLMTMDYWADRINVAIERGKVIKVVGVG